MDEFIKYIAYFAAVYMYLLAVMVIVATSVIMVLFVYIYGLFGGWDSYFRTDRDYMYSQSPNGIELIFETPDSGLTCKDLQMDSTRMYCITPYSILHGMDTISIGEYYDSLYRYDKDTWQYERRHDEWRPLFVHRTNGRVDTLCSSGRDKTWIGYIQREYKDDKWLVVEAKQPDKILGKTHLVDKRSMSYRAHSMSDYDFDGQYTVFNSKISDYWIASRRSPDLYGPMNIKELKRVGASLGIEFPITLEGNADWEACPKDIKGNDLSDQYSVPDEPKSIIESIIDYYCFFTGRPDRVIE